VRQPKGRPTDLPCRLRMSGIPQLSGVKWNHLQQEAVVSETRSLLDCKTTTFGVGDKFRNQLHRWKAYCSAPVGSSSSGSASVEPWIKVGITSPRLGAVVYVRSCTGHVRGGRSSAACGMGVNTMRSYRFGSILMLVLDCWDPQALYTPKVAAKA